MGQGQERVRVRGHMKIQQGCDASWLESGCLCRSAWDKDMVGVMHVACSSQPSCTCVTTGFLPHLQLHLQTDRQWKGTAPWFRLHNMPSGFRSVHCTSLDFTRSRILVSLVC